MLFKFIDTSKKEGKQKPKQGRDSGHGNDGGSRGVGQSGRIDRLQDKGLQEMRDDGACLSMHQPWASLVVHGIKL